MIKQAHLRVGIYWHVFPTYGEAKDSVWRDPNMLFSIIPEKLIEKKYENELIIKFKNGSIYQLKGSDDPEALRGPNPVGVIFDEFDTQKDEGWKVIEPILRANGGWAWFIGTPRGKQKLYDFYQRGKSNHKEWDSWILRASASGIIANDQLEESKRSLPESFYMQEYECEFLQSTGSVFRGVRDIATATPSRPLAGRQYVMGVDLAKVQDFTVIRVYDKATNELVYTDRWQTLDWTYQKSKIATYARYYNNCLVIVDATGLGDPIADDLIQAGVSVIPFKITNQNKKEMIEKLSLWIEQKRFKILKSDTAFLEYDNFTYGMSKLGKVTYGARSGYHDDIVMADALAIWHLGEVYMSENVRELTPVQIMFARARAKYIHQQENKYTGDGEDLMDEWGSNNVEVGGY